LKFQPSLLPKSHTGKKKNKKQKTKKPVDLNSVKNSGCLHFKMQEVHTLFFYLYPSEIKFMIWVFQKEMWHEFP
jgi:hypothetical protein